MSILKFCAFTLIMMVTNPFLIAAVVPQAKPEQTNQLISVTGGSKIARQGGSLTYAFYEPTHLNPITYRDSGAREILEKWVFESLLDFDVATHQPIPRIAEKWEISPDGKTFTFWLNPRAKWKDGKPITSEDIRFSFEVFGIKGVKALPRKASLNNFARINTNGNKVEFIAKETLFRNFYFLATTLIVPKHLYAYPQAKKINKNKYTSRPEGSGPYYVKNWIKGDKCVLARNPNYWGASLPQNTGAFNFQQIIIKYIRDRQMAFEMLKKGKIDFMHLWIDHWQQARNEATFKTGKIRAIAMDNKMPQGFGYIGFNLSLPLFQDPIVRKAIYQAINKNEMIKKNLDGLAVVPRGPLYSYQDYSGTFVPPEFDRKAASKILAQQGWKDTDGDYVLDKGGKKFTFTLIVANAKILKEALFIQDGLKQIGIDMKVKQVEWNTFVRLLNERHYDAFANGKNRKIVVDPYFQFHSHNIGKGKSNVIGYSNPKVDKLIETGLKEMNQEKRKVIFTQVNDIISNDFAIAQWSEIKYAFLAISDKVKITDYQNKPYFPYSLGMKYWFK